MPEVLKMTKEVTFSPTITRGIGVLLILDVIRRGYLLLKAPSEELVVQRQGALVAVVLSLLAVITIFRSSRYFPASTAKNLIYSLGGGAFLVTMAYLARYFGWSSYIVPLDISVLGVEILAVFMCSLHIRRLRLGLT